MTAMDQQGRKRGQPNAERVESFLDPADVALPLTTGLEGAASPSNLGQDVDVHLANDRQEMLGAFGLVYRAYVARRYVAPHPGRIHYHRLYCLPTSRTIVACRESGQVIGTLTLVEATIHRLPMEVTFAGEVGKLRRNGRSLAEVTGLAVDSRLSPEGADVFVALTRFMVQYAYWRRIDDLLMAVHPRHAAFYRRRFAVDRLGPRQPHAPVGGNPAIACRIDLRRAKHKLVETLVDRYLTPAIDEAAFDGPRMRQEDHWYFCRRMGWDLGATEPTRQRAA